MNLVKKHSQTGFTLLELIVVIGLLGLVTSLATDFMINETNSQRAQTTKQRLEQIRYAILGDSSRSLNGQPTISGFIADTGRLPASTANLLSNIDYCTNPEFTTEATCVSTATWEEATCSNISYTDQSSCEANSETWILADSNWNGPYITANNGSDFIDGWANPITTTFASSGVMTITSLGLDRSAGASTGDEAKYEADSNNTILIKDYSTSGQSFNIVFNTTPANCDQFSVSNPDSTIPPASPYTIPASAGVSTLHPISTDVPYGEFSITPLNSVTPANCTLTAKTIFIHPVIKYSTPAVTFD